MLRVIDSPYIVIARNICVITTVDTTIIDAIFVSPTGNVIVSGNISEAAKSLISSWTISDLNSFSSDYYYSKWDQAFYTIDLMAKYGYLSYKSASDFEHKVNLCLSSRHFLIVREAA